MSRYHFYFEFGDLASSINNLEQLHDFVNETIHTLDRADCERGATLYLNNIDTEKFVTELEAMDDLVGYIGILTYAETIGLFLEDLEANYWDSNPIYDQHEENIYYRHFDINSRSIIAPCNNLLKEVTEKSFSVLNNANEFCVIIRLRPTIIQKNHFIIRGNFGTPPQIIATNVINDFEELEDWIYSNMTMRTYNMSDNRHIEGNPGYLRGKSPLIGGIGGKANAKLLLKKAIGDRKDRQFLINFDNVNNRYIRYEFEGVNPQNGFHGYHLVKPNTHVQDEDAIKDTPIRIMKLLAYRLKLANII